MIKTQFMQFNHIIWELIDHCLCQMPMCCLIHVWLAHQLNIMLDYAHGHSTCSCSQAAALIANASSVPPMVNNKYDPGRATRRNQNPICTHFSKMHCSIYPSAFFCMNCEWWEREADHCNKWVSHQSKTYLCKAKHYSWFAPTLFGPYQTTVCSPKRKQSHSFLQK